METKNFIIKVSKLREGQNEFKFELTNDFFISNGSEINNFSSLIADIEVFRTDNTISLVIAVRGECHVDCDTCGNEIKLPISIQEKILVKIVDYIPDETDKLDEDIIYLRKSDDLLILDTVLFDLVLISIPLKKDCDIEGVEKNCDSVLLEKLKKLSQDQEKTDERWGNLKNIKFEN